MLTVEEQAENNQEIFNERVTIYRTYESSDRLRLNGEDVEYDRTDELNSNDQLDVLLDGQFAWTVPHAENVIETILFIKKVAEDVNYDHGKFEGALRNLPSPDNGGEELGY